MPPTRVISSRERLQASPARSRHPSGSLICAHTPMHSHIDAGCEVASSPALECEQVPPRRPQVRLATVVPTTQSLPVADNRGPASRPRVHVVNLSRHFMASAPRQKQCSFTPTSCTAHDSLPGRKAIAAPRISANEHSRAAARQRSREQEEDSDGHRQERYVRGQSTPQSGQDGTHHGASVHQMPAVGGTNARPQAGCSLP
jgi:hypothetical protein